MHAKIEKLLTLIKSQDCANIHSEDYVVLAQLIERIKAREYTYKWITK